MLLRGATLLHLDPPDVTGEDLRVEDGLITEVGAGLAPRPGEEIVELDGAWLMPGLVNAHHHLYSALATGMPLPERAPSSFADMLAGVWWRMDQALDLESVRACGLVGGLGALSAGVTTVIDHHASPGCIADSLETLDSALDEVGLRRVLCYEVTDRGGPALARAGIDAHRELLRAGRAGARLAGDLLGVPLGQLRPGAAADLVVLEPPPGPPLSAASLPATLVFRLSSSAVRHVLVGGRWRLWNRAPTLLNARSVNAEAIRAATALWARMQALPSRA